MPLIFALAQGNFTVGDISGNVQAILRAHKRAVEAKADMLIVSEMAVTGYPPEDLVLRRGFQNNAMQAIDELAAATKNGPAILTGGIWREGESLYNTVFLLEGGAVAHRQYKHNLPNYGVFDEKRVFAKGPMPQPVLWRGMKLGVLLCEDMWEPDVAANMKANGAEILISLNASPYQIGKKRMRLEVARKRTEETGLPLMYVNQAGGQDELVFDGQSFALSAQWEVMCMLPAFTEAFACITWNGGALSRGEVTPPLSEDATIYGAMVLGLRDYVEKNRFPGVVLGLSGGIDSAITAAVAVDALGKERVRAVMLPSPYTSADSMEDAAECAKLLGIRLDTVPITPAMNALEGTLAPLFAGKDKDTTEENIQSRIRGLLLMAISNKDGQLVLTTGNKSEMSVGYATLYGDMCGGYSVLKDVYKTTVYTLSRWRNGKGRVIPERILTKAPSAELKPNQTDQDSLPPYDVLDAILTALIETQLSVDEIVKQGFDVLIVEKVAKMLYAAEYKRRQSPPGVKITGMSFGRDRRYPITNRWRM